VWDGEVGGLALSLEGHSGWVRSVAVYQQPGTGKDRIITGGQDNTIKVRVN
jgi:WD40 repeat protein